MDYEFTVVFDLDIKHNALASKDRSGLFMDKPEAVITADYGKKILKWCNAGTTIDEVKQQILKATSVVELRDILKAFPEFRSEIEALAIKRKEALNAEIINATKIGTNGTGKG